MPVPFTRTRLWDNLRATARGHVEACSGGSTASLSTSRSGRWPSLGRAAEALAVCDPLVRAHPNASEAHEARALALQALNRGDEADVEMKRALAADAQRSQMHVRLAGVPSSGR